jgi:hypothetical protein
MIHNDDECCDYDDAINMITTKMYWVNQFVTSDAAVLGHTC